MLGYYFNLALRSFRRNKALTALMVLAIALGIGASMTTLTVYHVLSGDPIPHKSGKLFYVQLEPQSKQGYQPGEEPPDQMTRFDSEELLRQAKRRPSGHDDGRRRKRGTRQGRPLAVPDQRTLYLQRISSPCSTRRSCSAAAGSAGDDAARAQVLVLSKKLNDKLFDGANSVGRMVRLEQREFRVVGVLDDWRPTPRFYDMNMDHYGAVEQVFLPFSTAVGLDMGRNGSMDCWGDSKDNQTALNAPCVWMQYWVELDSAAKVAAYRQYLENYSDQQRAAGRFERPNNVRLRNVMQWLDFNHVVPERRASAVLAGLRLPAGVPGQHGGTAAGQVPAPQWRDRRTPRAGRPAARDISRRPWSRPAWWAWPVAWSDSALRNSACGAYGSSTTT